MTRVAILDDYQNVARRMADWNALPAGATVDVFSDHLADPAAVARRLADHEVVVAMRERTPFPRALLERLPKLKLLITTGMRNASIDVAAAIERGVTVCGTGGLPYPTAELTWALILAIFRRVPIEDRQTREGRWQVSVGLGLNGKTLACSGSARWARAWRGWAAPSRCRCWRGARTSRRRRPPRRGRRSSPREPARHQAHRNHPSRAGRPHAGADRRARAQAQKPTAHLVNTSRGPIVDEAALVRALRDNRIAGAALDVYDEEPLPVDHPLRHLPNTVITPHLGYVTEETYRIFYGQALEDGPGVPPRRAGPGAEAVKASRVRREPVRSRCTALTGFATGGVLAATPRSHHARTHPGRRPRPRPPAGSAGSRDLPGPRRVRLLAPLGDLDATLGGVDARGVSVGYDLPPIRHVQAETAITRDRVLNIGWNLALYGLHDSGRGWTSVRRHRREGLPK